MRYRMQCLFPVVLLLPLLIKVTFAFPGDIIYNGWVETVNENMERKVLKIMAADGSGKRISRYADNYIVFDLETTGINSSLDEIIELSAVKVKNHVIEDTYSTLVNPGFSIPASATSVNGITDEMVKDAPVLDEVFSGFLDFIGQEILVGHNIHCFDMKFLYGAVTRLGRSVITNDYIDTLYMARTCLPELQHHRLTDISRYFKISTQGAHRALNDCMMNQRCYEELGKILLSKDVPICPQCGSELMKRSGRFGEFYGCSNYPSCRYTKNISRAGVR